MLVKQRLPWSLCLCIAAIILIGALVTWYGIQEMVTKVEAKAKNEKRIAQRPRTNNTPSPESRRKNEMNDKSETREKIAQKPAKLGKKKGNSVKENPPVACPASHAPTDPRAYSLMYPRSQLPDLSSKLPAPPSIKASNVIALENLTSPTDSIYPFFWKWHCMTENLCLPGMLKHNGTGKVFVDVGVQGGIETINAVRHGFLTFSFDPVLNDKNNQKTFIERVPEAIRSKFRFVECEKDVAGHWALPQLHPPPTAGGFAYIFPFGLSDQDSKTTMRLDSVLPHWVEEVYYLKIDTDGHDIQALRGARESLARRQFRFIQFEFLPWQIRKLGTGNPMELLTMIPSQGGICFDTMGAHSTPDHPISPISKYFKNLDAGVLVRPGWKLRNYTNDLFGPWEDILCHVPAKPLTWTDEALHRGFDVMINSACPSRHWSKTWGESSYCDTYNQTPMD